MRGDILISSAILAKTLPFLKFQALPKAAILMLPTCRRVWLMFPLVTCHPLSSFSGTDGR